MEFQRHAMNPILLPNPHHPWEALNVFNCAVVYHDDLFHMFYRAQGVDYKSSIGYAISEDGVKWNRFTDPVLSGSTEYETRGVEDPRIVEIDGTFYMTYTAYSEKGILSMLAESQNLVTWRRIAPFEWDNKDHVLFPRKIGGRFAMLHRRPPDIWLAYSDDLKNWDNHQIIIRPREGLWDNQKVGASGPPIYTDAGWLIIYHGVDEYIIYRQGAVLLDLEDPSKIICRAKSTMLYPQESWELKGDVPNVVFSCANPVVDGTIYLYYAGADRLIGLATAPLDDVLAFVRAEG
jgi:beta-1,2-mannobiose phosphorylase / 1,2-beta-oligomannan phosphorylase